LGPGIALVERAFELFGGVGARRQVAADQGAQRVVGGRIKVRIAGHETDNGFDQVVGGDNHES
jgi:hypothetical protein